MTFSPYLLTLMFVLLLVILFAYFLVRQKKKILVKQQQGLELILQVRNLISNIQKHRGWSSAYARGDHSVTKDLHNLQNQIKSITGTLVAKYPIAQFERWFGYTEHWERLSDKVFTLSSDNSFKQHTQLIGNMLYLLEDIAERNYLTVDVLKNFPVVSLLWRELLQVAECVGQSRALGTGVATVKVCSRVEKIRLGFLRQKITETAEIVYAQLSDSNRAVGNAELTKLIEQASKKTRYLTAVIEHELVEAEQIKLDAKNYFALATETITALNQIFDLQLKELEKYLNKNS